MADITLEPGDKTKIISQPPDGRAYNVSNFEGGAEIYCSHNPNGTIREGIRVRPGDRTKFSNLRGKSVYAVNPSENTENATFNVSRAAFSVTFESPTVQPPVEGDTNAGQYSAAYQHVGASGADPSGTVTEALTLPDRAGSVALLVNNADNTFNVEVRFNNTEVAYSGDGSTPVDETRSVVGDSCTVEITGAATTCDYDIYAR